MTKKFNAAKIAIDFSTDSPKEEYGCALALTALESYEFGRACASIS